jgi:hypothetical protein
MVTSDEKPEVDIFEEEEMCGINLREICVRKLYTQSRTSPSVILNFFHHLTICGATSSRAKTGRDLAKADIIFNWEGRVD